MKFATHEQNMNGSKYKPWRNAKHQQFFPSMSSKEIEHSIGLRDLIGMGEDYFHYFNKDFILSNGLAVAFVRDTTDDYYQHRFSHACTDLGILEVCGITTCPTTNQSYLGEPPIETSLFDPPLIAKASVDAIARLRSTELTTMTTSYLVFPANAALVMLVQNSEYLLFAGVQSVLHEIVGMPAHESWNQLEILDWLEPTKIKKLRSLQIEYGMKL